MKGLKLTVFLILMSVVFVFTNNTIAWQKTYEGNQLGVLSVIAGEETSDNGFILCGNVGSYIHLIKTDYKGDVIWTMSYTNRAASASSIQQIPDGYLIGGSTAGGMYLVKVNTYGAFLWGKIFSEGSTGACARAINDKYVICGNSGNDICLVETDTDGVKNWGEIYDTTTGDTARSVAEGINGGYVIAGVLEYDGPYGSDKDLLLVKVGVDGQEEWRNNYGGEDPEEARWVIRAGDRYVISGENASQVHGSEQIWVVWVDLDGNRREHRLLYDYSRYEPEYGQSVSSTSDGGYVVCGFNWEGAKVYLIKLASNTTETWMKSFDINRNLAPRNAEQTADGGYAIFGKNYIIKTDSEGNDVPYIPVASNPFPEDSSISGSDIITLEITDDIAIDPQTIRFRVRDKIHTVANPILEYDEYSELLIYKPSYDAKAVFSDDEVIDCELITVEDFDGNPIEAPYTWSWTYDFALDTIPPDAPKITSPGKNVISVNEITIEWNAYDLSGIGGYSYTFSQDVNVTPDETADIYKNKMTFKNLTTGIWYFNVRAVDKAKNWGPVRQFPVIYGVDGIEYYVNNVTGSDDNFGLSWDTAYATIQKAIVNTPDGFHKKINVAATWKRYNANGDKNVVNIARSGNSEEKPLELVSCPMQRPNAIIDCQEFYDSIKKNNGIVINGNYIVVDGFVIRNAKMNGIRITDSSYVKINNNIVMNNEEAGIQLINSHDIDVSNNEVKDNNLNGIDIVTGSGLNIISGNTCSGNKNGIKLYTGCNGNEISGNTSYANDSNGISVTTSLDNKILNNVCYNNLKSGLALGITSENNLVDGNNSYNNTENGIHLFSVDENTISGNIFENNDKHGILVEESENNILKGNQSLNNLKQGIFIRSESSYNQVLGNTCNGNIQGIYIEVDSQDVYLACNNIMENNIGILVKDSSIKAYKNIVFNNAAQGILLQNTSAAEMMNNTICKHRSGVLIDRNSSASFVNDISTENTSYAIYSETTIIPARYSCLNGNTKNVTLDTGTITSDPLLSDTSIQSPDFHLTYDSPASGTGEYDESMGRYTTHVKQMVFDATSDYEITFKSDIVNGSIPVDGKIVIEFPGDFYLGGVSGIESTTMDGSLSFTRNGQVITIARSGGTATAAGGVEKLLIKNVYTIAAGTEHRIVLETRDGADNVIDMPETSNDFEVKFDQTPVWQRFYDGNEYGALSIIAGEETTDDGFILCGNTGPYIHLIKTDYRGDIEWRETYTDRTASASSIQQLPDGYLIGGSTAGGMYLLKVSPDGTTIIREQIFSEGSTGTCARAIDDKYVICGNSGNNICLVETEIDGVKNWGEVYNTTTSDGARSVAEGIDGGYVMGGYTDYDEGDGNDLLLVKVGADGQEEWRNHYGGEDPEEGRWVIRDGNRYVMSGENSSYVHGPEQIWVVWADTDGEESGNTLLYDYSRYEPEYGHSISRTSDGGYVVCGFNWEGAKVYLIKLYPQGYEDWMKSFDIPRSQTPRNAEQTTDGGYAIFGKNYIIKTDSQGGNYPFLPPMPIASDPEPPNESTSGSDEITLQILDDRSGSIINPSTITPLMSGADEGISLMNMGIRADMSSDTQDDKDVDPENIDKGVNPESIILKVGDKEYTINDACLEYDADNALLIFKPNYDSRVVFADGEVINCELVYAEDYDGNPIEEPYKWSWIYDVDLDNIPPEAPKIISPEENIILAVNEITIEWDAFDLSGIDGYSYTFSLDVNVTPDTIVDTLNNNETFQNLTTGIWYFNIRAVDKADNWSDTSQLLIINDVTAPVSEIVFGDPNYTDMGKVFITSDSLISINSEDPIINGAASGVKITSYRINNGPWTEYTSAFKLASMADGDYTIGYYSIDNVDNEETVKESAVYLDNTPPAVPVGLIGYIEDTLNVALFWDDVLDSGLEGYNIYEGSVKLNNEIITEASYFIANVTGEHTYRVSSIDLLGNESGLSDPVTVTIDNTIAITYPESEFYYREQIKVEAEISTAKKANLVLEYGEGVNPAEWTTIKEFKNYSRGNDLFKHPWNLLEIIGGEEVYLNGTYRLRIRVEDKNGSYEDSQVVWIDNTAPETELIAGSQSVTFDPVDPEVGGIASGIKSTKYIVSETPITSDDDAIVWDNEPIVLASGTYYFMFYSEDNAEMGHDNNGNKHGNIEAAKYEVVTIEEIIILELPGDPELKDPYPLKVPVIEVTGVADGEYYNSDICFNVSISDQDINNWTILFKQNGAIKNSFSGDSDVSKELCTTGDGKYLLKVDADDQSKFAANQTIEFTVDSIAPAIIITGVEDDGVYDNEVQPVINVVDENIDSITINLMNNDNKKVAWNGEALTEPGEYSLKVEAEDLAGNKTESPVIKFTIKTIELEDSLVFKAEYDTGSDADLGLDKKDYSDGIVVEGGIEGNALISELDAKSKPGARYKAENNIDAEKGTIMMWINPSWSSAECNNDDQGRYLFSLYKNQNNTSIEIAVFKENGTKVNISVGDDKSDPVSFSMDKDVAETERWYKDGSKKWTHLAIGWDSQQGTIKIYIDGELKGTYTEEKWDPMLTNGNIWMKIGDSAKGESTAFNGKIDKVKIYNMQLTDAQVDQIYSEENK